MGKDNQEPETTKGGYGPSEQEKPAAGDPRDQPDPTPKHGHGRGSGGGV